MMVTARSLTCTSGVHAWNSPLADLIKGPLSDECARIELRDHANRYQHKKRRWSGTPLRAGQLFVLDGGFHSGNQLGGGHFQHVRDFDQHNDIRALDATLYHTEE